MLNINENGFYLSKEQPAGNYTIVAQTGPAEIGEWHQIVIGTQDGHLQVYVDEELWIDYIDPSPINHGSIGVASMDGSQVMVDNVRVIGLTAPLPSGVVQAPPVLEGAQPPEAIADGQAGDGLPLEEVEQVEEPSSEQAEEAPGDVGLPDLYIANFQIQPESPKVDSPVQVTIAVGNQGDAPAGAFSVRWNPAGATEVGCSWNFGPLSSGVSQADTCMYTGYAQAGTYNWGVVIDADNEVAESDKNNNRMSGDIIVSSGLKIPDAPTNCTAQAISSSRVQLSWQAVADLTRQGFRIYQGLTSLEVTVPSNVNREYIDNLAQATQYQFDVRAFNEAGESPAGACEVHVTTAP